MARKASLNRRASALADAASSPGEACDVGACGEYLRAAPHHHSSYVGVACDGRRSLAELVEDLRIDRIDLRTVEPYRRDTAASLNSNELAHENLPSFGERVTLLADGADGAGLVDVADDASACQRGQCPSVEFYACARRLCSATPRQNAQRWLGAKRVTLEQSHEDEQSDCRDAREHSADRPCGGRHGRCSRHRRGDGYGVGPIRPADVAVLDKEPRQLPEVVAQIEAAGRRGICDVVDARDDDAVAAFLGRVHQELGPIDVLVNNAGGGFWSMFAGVSPKGEHTLIRENFSTVTNCVRHGVPLMSDGGAIVNVTSVEAYHAAPGFAVYAAMKAAVTQFTMSMALELGGAGNPCQLRGAGHDLHSRRRATRRGVWRADRGTAPDTATPHGDSRRMRRCDRVPRLRHGELRHRSVDPSGRRNRGSQHLEDPPRRHLRHVGALGFITRRRPSIAGAAGDPEPERGSLVMRRG